MLFWITLVRRILMAVTGAGNVAAQIVGQVFMTGAHSHIGQFLNDFVDIVEYVILLVAEIVRRA